MLMIAHIVLATKTVEFYLGKMETKFQVMADYLTANRLKVNNDKTHVMLMCSEQKLRRQSVELSMNVGDCVIASSRT